MRVSAHDLAAAGLCAKEAADRWAAPLSETMERFKINTPMRAAQFLAQVAHESGGFRLTVENLNYSADALLRVFRKYFPTDEMARAYARQPEKIANRVYGGRMGNGDEASGDGWRFRGRGLIQLTGRSNYAAFARDMAIDVIREPDRVERAPLAAISAGWFWDRNNLNVIADTGDVEAVTRRVNGGTHGLDDRRRYYENAMRAFRSKAA